MKLFISSVILLMTYLQGNCNYTKLINEQVSVPDSIGYAFINHVLKTNEEVDYIHCKYLLDKVNIDTVSSYDSILLVKNWGFSKDDIIYMNQQAKEKKEFELDLTYIKGKDILSFDNYFMIKKNYLAKDMDKDLLCAVGMPLFSRDKSAVIISISLYCGIDCGRGRTFLYKKIDGQYILPTTLAGWHS